MKDKPFINMLKKASQENRRLVAPLLGFPGLNIIGCNIKEAQQNYERHFQAIKALSYMFQPDIVFPLMDFLLKPMLWGIIQFSPNILKGAYVTGPYSLAALMIGAEEAAMSTVMEPEKLEQLCQFATEQIQKYIHLLIAGGAQVICILEPSAVMLGPDQFETFSSKYVSHISRSCKFTNAATIYHTCGNTMHLIEQMVASGVDGISLDSLPAGVDLPAVAAQVPEEVAIIGNISPTETMLNGREEEVEKEVFELLEQMKTFPNYVLSTGCDLPQEVPLRNIHAFMNAGRKYRL